MGDLLPGFIHAVIIGFYFFVPIDNNLLLIAVRAYVRL